MSTTTIPGQTMPPPRRRRKPRWMHYAELTLLTTAVVAIALYGGDWAIFLLRGQPHSAVTVEHYLVVPLKGKKTEYDDEGQRPVPCARSLFPQGAWSPCWYLRRHPIVADTL